MTYKNRKYLIIPVSQLSQINFDEVLETSAETVRKSVDESKTFVKWEGEMLQSLVGISGAEGPYTHEEILAILSGEDWTPTIEDII
jgi:hypothetical protein